MSMFGFLLIVVSVSFGLGCLIGYKLKGYKLEEEIWEADAH
jgi:hypothetical protein